MTIEQVSNLNSDIKHYRVQTSQANAILSSIDEAPKLLLQLEKKQKENLIEFLKLSKQRVFSEIEYFRKQLETVRKISPKTAQRLERSINSYGRTGKVIMETISYLERTDITKIKPKQMIKFVDELEIAIKRQATQSKDLESTCELISDFLVDVMEYFEKEK